MTKVLILPEVAAALQAAVANVESWQNTMQQALQHLTTEHSDTDWSGTWPGATSDRLAQFLAFQVRHINSCGAAEPILCDVLFFEIISMVENAAKMNTATPQAGDAFIVEQFFSAASSAFVRYMEARLEQRINERQPNAPSSDTAH